MVVEYEDKNKFKALAHILEDYMEWFGNMAMHTAYHDTLNVTDKLKIPSSLIGWLEDEKNSADISPSVTKPIIDMNNSLLQISDQMIENIQQGKKPEHEDFLELKNIYSFLLGSIRRLEKDSAMKGDGTDDITGLRPASAIKNDLDREMERLSRNGNPFALVVGRIDDFDDMANVEEALVITSDNIRRSLRPFDDAYYLENGQFLLSLKHADMVGAEAAVLRIQQYLEIDEKNPNKITLSCCMSEPVTGDEIKVLIKNMENDLNENSENDGAVLKFLDISPLERFIGKTK